MLGLGVNSPEIPLPPCTHVRIWDSEATWKQINVAPGQYAWEKLDEQVHRANGKYKTYVFGSTPRWAARDPDSERTEMWAGGPGSNSVPANMADWTSFVEAVVTRYQGQINAYEIWNEPQLSVFLFPYSKQQLNMLAQMTKAAYQIIKRVDPKARVLAASILPRPSSGGMRKARLYLDALAEVGWPVDGYSTHIYPESGQGASRWAQLVRDVQAKLSEMRAPRRNVLWVTETLFGFYGEAPADMPSTIRDTYSYAQQLGISQIYWYAWNRPDLSPSVLAPGTPTWGAILANQ